MYTHRSFPKSCLRGTYDQLSRFDCYATIWKEWCWLPQEEEEKRKKGDQSSLHWRYIMSRVIFRYKNALDRLNNSTSITPPFSLFLQLDLRWWTIWNPQFFRRLAMQHPPPLPKKIQWLHSHQQSLPLEQKKQKPAHRAMIYQPSNFSEPSPFSTGSATKAPSVELSNDFSRRWGNREAIRFLKNSFWLYSTVLRRFAKSG